MADIGGSQNDAFAQGQYHAASEGRANTSSITLGGALQTDSARSNAMSPHGVLSAAMGAGNDLAYQRMSRIALIIF